MLRVSLCCGRYTLKTGAYIAAVLFMIRSIVVLVRCGLCIAYGSKYDIIDSSVKVVIWSALLIFSIKVIIDIRKENTKIILAFLLILFYYFVADIHIVIYTVIYFFVGYHYNILDYFVITPMSIIVGGYSAVIIYSFYRQLQTAQNKLNTKEITPQNEMKQIPA